MILLSINWRRNPFFACQMWYSRQCFTIKLNCALCSVFPKKLKNSRLWHEFCEGSMRIRSMVLTETEMWIFWFAWELILVFTSNVCSNLTSSSKERFTGPPILCVRSEGVERVKFPLSFFLRFKTQLVVYIFGDIEVSIIRQCQVKINSTIITRLED